MEIFWKERPALVVFESRLIKALSPYKITTAINRTSKKKKKCLSVFLMFHLAAFFLSVLNSHRSLQKMTSYSSKVQKLSAVRQVSFLVILKSLVIWKWRSDLEGYTVLHNMFLISSSYTLSACERRSGGGVGWGVGGGADFKACSEIYLKEGPHSLIDANTFPGRHTTCSGCQRMEGVVPYC